MKREALVNCLFGSAVLLAGSAPSARAATIVVPDDEPAIQAGIEAAAAGDTVLVLPGTYAERIDFLGKAIVVTTSGGPEATVIDGEPDGGGVRCLATSPTIEGNRIAGNRAGAGGGVYCLYGSPDICDNLIEDNVADGFNKGGGGIACEAMATPLITGNRILGNRTTGFFGGGGGIICRDGSAAMIAGNEIRGNVSEQDTGAGITCFRSDAEITGNTIADNVSAGSGGGVIAIGSSATVTRNLIVRNVAPRGGGLKASSAPSLIQQNTLVGNVSTLQHGSTIELSGGATTITRNIIALGVSGHGIDCAATPDPMVITCNAFFSNELGAIAACEAATISGNFEADPQFCDPDADDYTLGSSSPCLPGHHPQGEPCGLIGAFDVGCSPTAIAPSTWGRIKRQYGESK